jgi:hypothetical protein
MCQKWIKTTAELVSIVTAELREHPVCDSTGVVVIRPMGLSWDAALVGDGPGLNSECNQRLAEIAARLRREFDLAD